MLMYLFALGLNHTTAPLGLREKVSFPGDALRDAVGDLRHRLSGLVPETAILSTCNRTEIYCATLQPAVAPAELARWLGDQQSLDGHRVDSQWTRHLYTLPDGEAVRHAFRVACGLDSMVLG